MSFIRRFQELFNLPELQIGDVIHFSNGNRCGKIISLDNDMIFCDFHIEENKEDREYLSLSKNWRIEPYYLESWVKTTVTFVSPLTLSKATKDFLIKDVDFSRIKGLCTT